MICPDPQPLEPFQRPLIDDARFPRWLPDETLHSWLCRYHLLSGGSRREITCRRLFGIGRWRSRHDLPFHLAALHERSGGLLGSSRSMALDRTIVRMFLPFLPAERASTILNAMSVPGRGSVAAKIGLLRSGVSHGHPLKACPICLVDDRREFHIPYWHRSHQCPGVWICLKHRCPLLVLDDPELTPWEWHLPIEQKMKVVLHEEATQGDGFHRLVQLASFVKGVLDLPADVSLDPATLRQVVVEQLAPRGLVTNHVVRLRGLVPIYIQAWGVVAKDSKVLPFRTDQPALYRWLAKLLDKDFTGCHPLAWLTVVGLFFDSWADFTGAYAQAAVDTRRRATSPTLSMQNDEGGLSTLSLRRPSGKRLEGQKRELQALHRATLERCRNLNPYLSRALLRLECPAAYSWLLVNDREWIEARLPPSKDRRERKSKDAGAMTAGPQLAWRF